MPMTLYVLWLEASVLRDPGQHLRAYFIFVMESENHIGPARARQDLMRTGFAFDGPADPE